MSQLNRRNALTVFAGLPALAVPSVAIAAAENPIRSSQGSRRIGRQRRGSRLFASQQMKLGPPQGERGRVTPRASWSVNSEKYIHRSKR
jgi:hypothetical protein